MIIKIPLEVVAIEADGFHLFVKARINRKPAKLLLDTGASKTVFDINRIREFIGKRKKSFESFEKLSTGLGTNSMESSYTALKEVSISKLKLPDFTAILLDMAHVNQSYEMLKIMPIDGVLGSDLLTEYKAVIDFEKQILMLKK
jgi:predicted aspartyl protease